MHAKNVSGIGEGIVRVKEAEKIGRWWAAARWGRTIDEWMNGWGGNIEYWKSSCIPSSAQLQVEVTHSRGSEHRQCTIRVEAAQGCGEESIISIGGKCKCWRLEIMDATRRQPYYRMDNRMEKNEENTLIMVSKFKTHNWVDQPATTSCIQSVGTGQWKPWGWASTVPCRDHNIFHKR